MSYDAQDDDVCDRHWTVGRICHDVIRRSPFDRCYESVVFAESREVTPIRDDTSVVPAKVTNYP